MGAKKPETDKRFAKFGVVGFTATSKVNKFMEYLEQGKVAGNACSKCGAKFFPPRADCPTCIDQTEMEWFEVAGTGELMTYSLLQYAPVGFQEEVPYAIAVADYGDYKVFARIKELGDGDIPLGSRVKTVVKRLPEDRYIFEFVPQP